MRRFVWLLVFSLAVCATASAQDKGPDWVKVTDKAAWKARDSQGELVYRDRMWIFGGWFQSFEAPPRDVWSSADGKTWKLVTEEAPWVLIEGNDKDWARVKLLRTVAKALEDEVG